MKLPLAAVSSLALFIGTVVAAEDLRYVAAREVTLSYQTPDQSAVESVELWVSTDNGHNWQETATVEADDETLRFTAEDDGRHMFYFVLRNAGGASSGPPGDGSKPHATVVVDTTAPALQLHDAYVKSLADLHRRLHVDLTLIDENLGKSGVRVFHRSAGTQTWMDGGVGAIANGHLTWDVPTDAGQHLDIRIVAADLAGNRSTDEALMVRSVIVRPTSQPAATQPSRLAFTPAQPVTIQPVEPLVVQPVAPLDTDGPPTAQQSEPKPEAADVRRQRRLAERYMAEGRYPLAIARFEDALDITPDDPDLLAAHGSALYRNKQYSDAGERFQAALRISPDNLGALEGLALVAATQKRYPDARTHLLRLLELEPESAKTWLRYGDIEHKLGNKDQALRAWQRVLEMRVADKRERDSASKRLTYFAPTRAAERP